MQLDGDWENSRRTFELGAPSSKQYLCCLCSPPEVGQPPWIPHSPTPVHTVHISRLSRYHVLAIMNNNHTPPRIYTDKTLDLRRRPRTLSTLSRRIVFTSLVGDRTPVQAEDVMNIPRVFTPRGGNEAIFFEEVVPHSAVPPDELYNSPNYRPPSIRPSSSPTSPSPPPPPPARGYVIRHSPVSRLPDPLPAFELQFHYPLLHREPPTRPLARIVKVYTK